MRELKKELWPYQHTVEITKDKDSLEIWLGESLGVFRGKWNVVYHLNKTVFYFKEQSDAFMFALRWA